VPKKHKHKPTFAPSTQTLRERISRAREEGRFQHALELAKQLHHQEPTPANLELLKEVYLGRARQLRGQGQTREAVTVLDVALRLDEATPAWLAQIAEELAQSGDARRTFALLEKLPDPALSQRVLVWAADAALVQGSAARAALPPALQADFDRIGNAFAQVEAGQDEAARATLQDIGLRSPFLEWKLLLRGLQAYWQNDDVRAVENWQRLTPERVPARLAAPYRFQIDPAFRAAQPPATQAILHKQLDQLQGSALLTQLRTLRATLADRHKMTAALRQAEALLPALRQQAPQLVPRLAACFYWGVLETGPDDVLRYRRVFGPPPDDPNFDRLNALGYERAGDLARAHTHWRKYEEEIAAHPERWPGDQAAHARAYIWRRMGDNAASTPARPGRRSSPLGSFLFEDEPDAPLNPPAEKCYQQSLELAPDQLEAHVALVRHHLEAKREGKADKAARKLLEQFPDHVPTLEMLSDLRKKRGDYTQSLQLALQALQSNPLDRRLRRKAADAYMYQARAQVESGAFDEARRGFQAALDLGGGMDSALVLARWAAGEFKAGDPTRAEELIAQALAATPAAVGVAYLMLTEVLRLKLNRALKTRFDGDWKASLAVPTPEGAVFLARVLADLHRGGITYVGQKGHTTKNLAYIHKAHGREFSEPQLEELCQNLLDLEVYPRARRYADLGERLYPNNPLFPYLHALGWIRHQGRRVQPYNVVPLLQRAQRLAQARPPDERRERMLADIEQHLQELNPFDLDFLGRLFGFQDGPDDAEDDYDDDDPW
jgi:tetratricopeptide (TPR) repeat protein